MPQARRRQSLADAVHDQLRRMIVTLELRPGEILLEKDLCSRFGVSRTPVREAVLRLSEHGLVVVAPQHATTVARIDPDTIRQAHFLRENLEIPVVLRLCSAASPDPRGPRALVLEQQVALARSDPASFFAFDDGFHEALFELAGLDQLWGVIQPRKAHLDRVHFLQAPQQGKLDLLVREHEAILEAVARRDHAEAERVMRAHVSGALSSMERARAEKPELFEAPEANASLQASLGR